MTDEGDDSRAEKKEKSHWLFYTQRRGSAARDEDDEHFLQMTTRVRW
jgi:hypothetical protein